MSSKPGKNRVEAFSDGVIAIIITIMVLDLRIPEFNSQAGSGEVWLALWSLAPKLISYFLSFVVVAILWLNHHLLFDRLPHSTSRLVWHNTFLLFAMSLIPLPTSFMARYPDLPHAAAFYGAVMFLTSFAFYLMRRYAEVTARLISFNKSARTSNLVSLLLYLISVPLAFVSVPISNVIFVGIPLWYFVPDRFHR